MVKPMKPSSWASTESVEMLEFLRDRGLLSERKGRLFAAAVCRRVWHLLPDERLRNAVVVAERHADGLATTEELLLAQHAAYGGEVGLGPALNAVTSLTDTEGFDVRRVAIAAAGAVAISFDHPHCLDALVAKAVTIIFDHPDCLDALFAEDAAQADLLRDVFFNPLGVKPAGTDRLSWASWLRNLIFKPLPPPSAIDPAWLTWNTGTVKQLALAAYEERELPSGHLDPARLAILCDAFLDAGCPAEHELLLHLRGPGPHTRGCFAVDAILGRQ
jgi:hypothetical protein